MITFQTGENNVPIRFEMRGTPDELIMDVFLLTNCIATALRRMNPEIATAFVQILSDELGDPHSPAFTTDCPFPSVGAVIPLDED